MALTRTPVCDYGAAAPDFSLPGVDGRDWSRDQCRGSTGLMVVFISNHCPYVKAINSHLVRDAKALAGYGIGCVAIMPNDTEAYPEDSFENMIRVARDLEYPFPYLIDESQDVARAYGAVCTPDFYGYNANLGLQYRGRLDETGPSLKNENAEPELFQAMVQVAQTGKGPSVQIASMGCSIKWRV
jgi:peroxiredoxin